MGNSNFINMVIVLCAIGTALVLFMAMVADHV